MSAGGALYKTMKRIWFACLAVVLMALLCVPGLSAMAETTPLKISMELSANELTAPGEITVTIKLTNTSDTDTPGPVTLYYPSGKIIEEFGAEVLAAGQSRTWQGTWEVTQSQLEKGKITFAYVHPALDDEGKQYNYQKNFSKQLIYRGAEAKVEITRIITPTIARNGQEVSVTYEIANVGTADITNVNIKENTSISKTRGTIDSVPAGKTATYTFTVKMAKKDLTSAATITYKAGNQTYTEKKDEAVIKYGEVKLNATLSASKKGGNVGDTVLLTLTLKNTGSVDYQHITVTDPLLGELFTGVSVPAGETVKLEKELIIGDTADYQFTVEGQDSTGGSVVTATERVNVIALDPSKAINLTVNAAADRETVEYFPGKVYFTVTVTNQGAVEAKNVSVTSSGRTLYTFASIPAGESRSFQRDANASMAGQYRFEAKVKNELGEEQTFESNIVRISLAQPEVVVTSEPIPVPRAPAYEPDPTDDGMPAYMATVQNGLQLVHRLALVLACMSAALLAIGLVRRLIARSRVQDRLERSSSRNYIEESDVVRSGTEQAVPDEQPV